MSVQIEAHMAEVKQLTVVIEEKTEEIERLQRESQQSQGGSQEIEKLQSVITEKDEEISNLEALI